MARRSDIDWEAIEKDYRADVLTLREIAAKHGVHKTSISDRVKRHGWKKNLTNAIRRRALEKISSIDVEELIEDTAQESVQESARRIKSAVEQVADITVGVIVNHRKLIGRNIEISNRIETKIAMMLDQAAEIKDVVALSNAHKANVESKSKLITLERQAYNIDSSTDGENKQIGIEVSFV